MTTTKRVNDAVEAHVSDPTPETHKALLDAMQAANDAMQTALSFIERTRAEVN